PTALISPRWRRNPTTARASAQGFPHTPRPARWQTSDPRLPVHAACGPGERPALGAVAGGLIAAFREQLVGAVHDQILGSRGDRVGQLTQAAQRSAHALGPLADRLADHVRRL